MGRKANRKIKVVLEIDALIYQRLAVKAMELTLSVEDYLNGIVDPTRPFPKLPPVQPPLFDMGLTPAPAPVSVAEAPEVKKKK